MLIYRLAALALFVPAAFGQLDVVERINLSTAGVQADDWSHSPVVSDDGRYLAFYSSATNLVLGDTNGIGDIFHHDRVTGITTRCSVSSSGIQADKASGGAAISWDGRYVAFATVSDLFDPLDQNGTTDVYLHDTVTQTTELVSIGHFGNQGNDYSNDPALNFDGSIVVFSSSASNLVTFDLNNEQDIFLRDRNLGKTKGISRTVLDTQTDAWSNGPSVSSDGRYVAYSTSASNIGLGDTTSDADTYVYDTLLNVTVLATVKEDGSQIPSDCGSAPISADGGFIAFQSSGFQVTADDTNSTDDVFVRDLALGTTELASQASDGTQTWFHNNFKTSISEDGRYISWWTRSSVYLSGDTNGMVDVYVRDRQAGVTELVSSQSSGAMGNGESNGGDMSPDGRFIVYVSTSTDLVQGDTNGLHDIFLVDRHLGTLALDVVGNQAGQLAQFVLTGGTPSAPAVIGWNLGKQDITGSVNGLISLGPGFLVFIVNLDIAGNRSFPITIPPSFVGQEIWLQSIDVTTGLLSNSFRVDVQ